MMVRKLRAVPLRPSEDHLQRWRLLLAIDECNRALFQLQEQLKHGQDLPAAHLAWHEIRATLERAFVELAPDPERAPVDRAYLSLRTFLEQVLVTWDLSPSQRQRIELRLQGAERQRIGGAGPTV